MPYKIELRYFYGWDDAGWAEEDGLEITPSRFQTIREAQAAIDELFADVRAAVAAGDMDTEEAREDYRIVPANDDSRTPGER